MNPRIVFSVLGFLCVASMSCAQEDRASLIAQMEAAGENEYENERHAIDVDDCQVTTYRWKRMADGEWILWTSFELPMLLVDLGAIKRDGETKYFVGVTQEPGIAIIQFKGKDGYEFTHEKPFLREPKGDIEPSPRGDGTTHYIERKSAGMIVQSGPGVIEKATIFTNAWIRYVQHYCTFTG